VLLVMFTLTLDVVVPVIMPMIVMVIFDHLRRALPPIAWQHHIHLGGGHTAPFYLLDLDPDLGKTEPAGHPSEPIRRGSGGNQCSENHVAADSRGRVQNRKPCVRHRLTICLLGKPQANLGDVGAVAGGELALGVCGSQMIENALRLPLREPRHRGEFGDRSGPHAGKASKTFQQESSFGRSNSWDTEQLGSNRPLGSALSIVSQTEAMGLVSRPLEQSQ
jgi:hypothetical protein